MPLFVLDPNLRSCYLHIWFGNVAVNNELLGGSQLDWTFANTPVSTRELRVTGNFSGNIGPIVNYTLEPMNGSLTTITPYSDVEVDYNYYSGSGTLLLDTGSFKPKTDDPPSRRSTDGSYHYTIPNTIPKEIKFDAFIEIDSRAAKAFVNLSIVNSWFYLVVDEVAFAAYEGPIRSDQFLSVQKGDPIFVPMKVFVQKFGTWNPDTQLINWEAFKS